MPEETAPLTEHDQIRAFLVDLKLVMDKLGEAKDGMKSEGGIEFINSFLETITPAVREMKFACLVELGEV